MHAVKSVNKCLNATRVALIVNIPTGKIHLFTGYVMLMNRNIAALFKWRFVFTEWMLKWVRELVKVVNSDIQIRVFMFCT